MDCKSCGEGIPNWAVVGGKKVNLCKRHYCLACSPYGARARNKSGARIDSRKTAESNQCAHCKQALPSAQFYARSRGGLSSWCRKCSNAEALARHRAFKVKCVAYKGGECQRCSYSKYFGALDLHHRDPTQKDFSFSKARGHTWSEVIELELDKCDLLCSNCHRETHAEIAGVL